MTVAMRAVFVGEGALLIRCAQAWQAAGHAIVAVASAQAAILAWACGQGLPIERLDTGLRLPGLEFDYLFSIVNLRVLPESIVRRARRLALNFHDGPLPAYAGLNVTTWAVMAGERRHAVTWHEVTSAIDRGRIARESRFALAADETAVSLNARCHEAGLRAFESLIGDMARDDVTLAEQEGAFTCYGRYLRPKALATLDWHDDAQSICALVRSLDFGAYANPLAVPKLWLGHRVVLVRAARVEAGDAAAAPGTVLGISREGGGRLRVATRQGVLVVECLAAAASEPALAGIEVGQVLPAVAPAVDALLEERLPHLARAETLWRRVLGEAPALAMPYPRRTHDAQALATPAARLQLALEVREAGAATVAAFCAWLSSLACQEAVAVLYADAALADQAHGIEPWACAWVPLLLQTPASRLVRQACARADARVAQARQAGPMLCDLPWRLGGATAPAPLPRVGICLGVDLAPPQGHSLDIELVATAPGRHLILRIDTQVYAPEVAHVMARHLQAWLLAFAGAQGAVGDLPLAPADELAEVARMNDTAVVLDADGSVHEAVARYATVHADDEALRCGASSLSHGQLQARVHRLARVLRERGVEAGDVVGVCLARGPAMVVTVLAILRCGAAYLPLDPEYPPQRLRFMRDDAGARRVVCDAGGAALLALPESEAVCPDAAPQGLEPRSWPVVHGAQPAYVIYTSGSTGRPKGVVVSHGNVLNFMAGMDARLPHERGDRWLAVTSLSFDISVLELVWTLSRGAVVVLAQGPAEPPAEGAPAFSLFHFGCHATAHAERYRLLLEAARFADCHGFEAVWMPERHFHEFGGAYPNPAITAAAVAAVTQRVKVRAGSCVLPLHHPARVAEDWALVDNLSGGRAGVAFAAGWQPHDFVLAPTAFERRSAALMESLEAVRALWRGDAMECPGPRGDTVEVHTLPRPVQPNLPVWLAAASNPRTFEQAGRSGCHVLTHLLGQSVDEVDSKVAAYRAAWRAAGHAGEGQVTLMLHAFVGSSDVAVRDTARGPLKAFLGSSVDLVRKADWTFPTFAPPSGPAGRDTPAVAVSPSPQEIDSVLVHAVERYLSGHALIGSPARCLALVRQLQQAGIDEIACLVDFGIDTDTVLAHLQDLHALMRLAQRPPRPHGVGSITSALREQGITHLQCTPSMASLIVADDEGRQALSALRVMLVGGEALPVALARELRSLVPGRLMNMYGPTETTVWSTCCDVTQVGQFVPLGSPIANTCVHVRTAWGQECPALVPGEVFIGGAGVSQGYLRQPQLYAQRFIEDPARPGRRLYRTGDLARRHPDGRLEFLGRIDQQVKLRGHRVELGEIEGVLARQPGVRDAVVVAQSDAGGAVALRAFVAAHMPAPASDALRDALARELPDYMLPQRIEVRDSLPLTPNGKIDRQALASACVLSPVPPVATAKPQIHEPATAMEQCIAQAWREVLGVDAIDRHENFFDAGGHSLAMIQVQRRLQETTGIGVSLADMFRLTTVAALAAHLACPRPSADRAVCDGQARGRARRLPAQRSRTP